MFLAIINEDIMPSYTVLLAAMALGAIWLARPTRGARARGVRAVLARLADGMAADVPHPARHAGGALGVRAATGSGGSAGSRCSSSAWWRRPRSSPGPGRATTGAVGPFDLIWTGKAVRSVWAGFTWAKVGYMWDGMVGLPAGRRRGVDPRHPGMGHLALGRHGLDAGRGLLRAALPVAPLGRPAVARRCRRSSASPSWPARSSTSTPSRRTRRCRSTSWPG